MSKNRYRGFTIFELMLAVSLISITTMIAAPKIGWFLNQRAVASVKAQTVLLLLRAKSAAVSNRRPVTIQTTSSGVTATMTLPSGATQTLGLVRAGLEYKVTLASSASSLTIQPNGLIVSGTPFKIKYSRYTKTDSTMVTGYGDIK